METMNVPYNFSNEPDDGFDDDAFNDDGYRSGFDHDFTTKEQRRLRHEQSRERVRQMEAAEAAQLAEIMARPADWTCPNGEIYTHLGPGVDDDGNTTRVFGDWIPNVRNDTATAYTFVPSHIPGETEEERSKRFRAAYMTPAMKRDDRDIKMLDALRDDPDRRPVVTIRCNQCSTPRKMGKIYKIGRSYVLAEAFSYTFSEARINHLNRALAAREQGHEWYAQVAAASADVKAWPIEYVLDPLPKDHYMHDAMNLGMDCLLIGCRSHGNAMFSYAWLRDCGKKGEDVRVNPGEKCFVLESELPTDD